MRIGPRAASRSTHAPHAVAGTIIDVAPRSNAVVKSAGRVLQILEFFDEVQRDARVGDIAERLGYPQSSTSVLLKSLTQLGYMDYDAKTRTYLPSPRVALLGSWLAQGPVRDGSLFRLMEELNRETGETVILAARNGIYAQYIRVLHATNEMRMHVPIGSRRLLVWSATGFALLTRSAEDDVRALVRLTNSEARAGQKRIDPRKTLAGIAQARKRGYSFSRGLVTPGAGLIGMPLPDGVDRRDRPLVIGISGWIDDLDREETRIVRLMRETMQRYIEPAMRGMRPVLTKRRQALNTNRRNK
ncbi:MAG: IclR family transcriptional regulator [Burkholderiales bacterium]